MDMSMRNKFAQQYANNYVETAASEATPHKLVEMLYDGLIKHLTLSKVFIEQRKYEQKSEHINKSLAILNSLRDGVDLEKGGEVADNLFGLYDYCYRKMIEVSAKNDTAIIDEVIEHIKKLNEAWKAMPEEVKRSTKNQIERVSA